MRYIYLTKPWVLRSSIFFHAVGISGVASRGWWMRYKSMYWTPSCATNPKWISCIILCRKEKNAYILQTILNRGLDIQPIQSTIFCSDKDIVTAESAFSNGQTRFGLIPISLCCVFFLLPFQSVREEGKQTLGTNPYVYEESNSLPIWLNPTEIAWSTWSVVVWPMGIFHVPKLES